MTPEEKAKELFYFFHNDLQSWDTECGEELLVSILAIRYSLRCVDEVIKDRSIRGQVNFTYWKEVRNEINKL